MKTEALVIGANGLIGTYLTRALSKAGMVWVGTYCKRPSSDLLKLNILEEEEIKQVLFSLRPRVVFLCSNLPGGVDFSESHPDLASAFYVKAAQLLGMYCNEIHAQLFFISTDYVFDGNNGPYTEDSFPNPLNIYGKSKLQAEEWIQRHVLDYVIIRTTNVYGWDLHTVTPNYMMQLYRTLKEKRPFYAPSFLYGQPTYAFDLAQAMVELYQKKSQGIYHIVGANYLNRWEWALKACDILKLDRHSVHERLTPSSSFVPRPFQSRLNCQKFKSSFQTLLHSLSEGLVLMKNDMLFI